MALLIDGVRDVSHGRMDAPQEDIEVRPGEIAVLGQVNLDVRRVAWCWGLPRPRVFLDTKLG